MSIDALQTKIRKMKNPAAWVIAPSADQIPGAYLEREETLAQAAQAYVEDLLEGLRELVPAVRVNPGRFLLLGSGGMEALAAVVQKARTLGYYIILEWSQLEHPQAAEESARQILKEERWSCDGVLISGYGGSDCVKPWFQAAGSGKDVYVAIKTANKTGAEIQDLLTGGRTVYMAAADHLIRLGETAMERCGYSRLAVMVGGYNATSLKQMRRNYPRMFLMVDGVDESGCSIKNGTLALDRLGHGGLCCVSHSITAAWQGAGEGADPVAAAQESARRLKQNITRYVPIL